MLKRLARTIASLVLFMSPLTSVGATMPTCRPGDPVVWVNTKSHVYHLKGDRYFGTTKSGAYACKSKAVAAGAHASGSGKSAPGTSSGPMSAATPGADTSAGTPASPAPSKKKHHKKTKSSPSASPAP